MSTLTPKQISTKGIPKAIEKAQHYRLLNEPWEAESICLDVLAVDDANQKALVTLILALTDQFERTTAKPITQAQALLPKLADEYERVYYGGIIIERSAKAQLRQGARVHVVARQVEEAMQCYDRAQELAPSGNDDALLRWNTCVRMLEHIEHISPRPVDRSVPIDSGDGPPIE